MINRSLSSRCLALASGILSPGEGRHTIARRWRPVRGRTPGKEKNKIGTPARGDIMRGVNIHADFVMIQCTKKNLRIKPPFMPPRHRRGSNNVYSGPRGSALRAALSRRRANARRRNPGLAYAALPYGEALKFRSPTAPVFAEASPSAR